MKVETYPDDCVSADGGANVGEEITFRIFELSRGHRPMQVEDNRIGRELLSSAPQNWRCSM
ncbi:msr6061 [Mesorhizobium japonicum MAFF 303099]|uniref:Msr6061 protein n=1 Tax=Mesorhizobium japonicum (strain LMG 29417 / CECT 9101 / MAFF 303099) TaxID=266835 RepID=Q98AC7_RHILO|nr:msr6061 [Mesorhizobium japonicum MAFF 303099]